MVGSLSVPSGRFARGTVLIGCYFVPPPRFARGTVLIACYFEPPPRFARGTVLIACYFLCKAVGVVKQANVFPRSIYISPGSLTIEEAFIDILIDESIFSNQCESGLQFVSLSQQCLAPQLELEHMRTRHPAHFQIYLLAAKKLFCDILTQQFQRRSFAAS